jgi:hypothetical protein
VPRVCPPEPARWVSPSRAPETLLMSKNSAALILPPVSTMKRTKLLWSLYFAALMSLYTAAAARLLRGAFLEQAPRAARAHHAYVHQPGGAVLVLHLDVGAMLVPRAPCGVPSPSGSSVAWTARDDAMQCSRQGGVADAVVEVGHPHPPAVPAVESVQGLLGERRAGLLVGFVTLDYPLRPRAAPRPAVGRCSCTATTVPGA